MVKFTILEEAKDELLLGWPTLILKCFYSQACRCGSVGKSICSCRVSGFDFTHMEVYNLLIPLLTSMAQGTYVVYIHTCR